MQLRIPAAQLVAALASAGAGVVHATVAADHWSQWWGYGIQFLAAAVIQIGWAVAVLLGRSRALLGTGVALQAVFIGAWVFTRTLGHVAGPAAGTAEPVGYPGLLTVLLELVAIVGALLAMAGPAWAGSRYIATAGAGGAVVLAAASVAVGTALTGGHHGAGAHHGTSGHHGGSSHHQSPEQGRTTTSNPAADHQEPTTSRRSVESSPSPAPTSHGGDGHSHEHGG